MSTDRPDAESDTDSAAEASADTGASSGLPVSRRGVLVGGSTVLVGGALAALTLDDDGSEADAPASETPTGERAATETVTYSYGGAQTPGGSTPTEGGTQTPTGTRPSAAEEEFGQQNYGDYGYGGATT